MSRGIYDKINKVRIPTAGVETIPIDSELSSSSTHAVQNKVVKSAIDGNTTELNTHKAADATDSAGIHGFRVNNGTPQYYDNGWESIQVSSGSTVVVTTLEQDLYGRPVTLTDGTTTLTSAFSNSGSCTFSGVQLSGVLTVSSSTSGGDTAEDTIEVSYYGQYEVELEFPKIYGVSWDGSSSPAMTRTDAAANFSDPVPQMSDGNGGWTTGSSPFDNKMPWSGMQIVEDVNAGVLVSIPKYYYKWTKTGSAMTLQISMTEFDGSHVSPAHADRGDNQGERDVVYIGRYHCANSTYRSMTGVKPQASIRRSDFRTSIHNLGSDIWQNDFAMFWTIRMLYLVEFAHWNSQDKIGYGGGDGSNLIDMGYTDSMSYHTGTDQTSRTAYGGTQYRHIEGLWDNVYDLCDGIYFAGTNKLDVYAINNPSNFSDNTGGTKIGTRPNTNNVIKAWSIPSASGFEYALYPSEVVEDSNRETYICDKCYYYSSGVALCVGGSYYTNRDSGAFHLDGDISASSTNSIYGSRLMKLPNNS